MVEVDIEDALAYPRRGDGVLTLHAVGGGLPVLVNVLWVVVAVASIVESRLALLLLPLVPLQLAVGVGWLGYFVRVARATLDGATEPPALGDWGELARDGLWGTAVVLAFQVPLTVLGAASYALVVVLLLGAGSLGGLGSEELAVAGSLVGMVVMLVVFVLLLVCSLVVAYLLPVSLVAYADERSVRAAFSSSTLRTVALSTEYAVPWVLAAGLYFAVYSVVSFLTAILVGYLLVPFLPLVYFYVGTVAFYMFAQAYAEERGLAVPAGGTTDGTATETPATPAGKRGRGPEDV